jgi:hypothetical protein
VNLDEFALRGRLRQRIASLFQAFGVKLHGLTDEPDNLVATISCGDASGQVRHICAEPLVTFLDNG